MIKRLILFTIIITMLSSTACINNVTNTTNNTTNTTNTTNTPGNQNQPDPDAALREAKAKQEAEDKQAAQAVVEEFMNAFKCMDLKAMCECTDAQVDYTQMEFLSLSELKDTVLNEFKIFEILKLPVNEFTGIVDTVFNSYEKYADYKITSVNINGSEVTVEVNAEYIRAETMLQIIENAINKIDIEALEMKFAGSLILGGIMGGSVGDVANSALSTVLDSLELAVNRSVAELTPETGSMTFVLSKDGGEWVIRDNLSDYSVLESIFEITEDTSESSY